MRGGCGNKAAISAGLILGIVQTWSTSGAQEHAVSQERAVSIECGRDQSLLAVTVCSDKAASAAERRTTAAYLALYFSLNEPQRPAFRAEHFEWLSRLAAGCTTDPNSDGSKPALDCLTGSFRQRSDAYRKRLSPAALEEANQP